jgi:Protein of unknown function (DUF1566)
MMQGYRLWWTLAIVFIGPAPARAQQANNVDTGIGKRQCIEAESALLVTCRTSTVPGQDGQLGRDADSAANHSDDGALGFSFTKVCNSGEFAGHGRCPADPALGPGADEWACTRDNLSGIWWEVKTPSGPRSMWHRYTNYSAAYDPLGKYRSANDASGFVDQVNRDGLCGANDWTLGHAGRLQTVMHYGVTGSSVRIDKRFHPNTLAEPYWDASKNPSRSNTAWVIDFSKGRIDNDGDRGLTRPVRLVRGKAALGTSAGKLTVSADGREASSDAPGGVATWRRCVEGMAWNGSTCSGTAQTFTILDALTHAAGEAALTGLPWHVPNVKEMNWVVRRENVAPATDRVALPNTPVGNYCTASPDVEQPENSWVIDMELGQVRTAPRSVGCLLRLVR